MPALTLHCVMMVVLKGGWADDGVTCCVSGLFYSLSLHYWHIVIVIGNLIHCYYLLLLLLYCYYYCCCVQLLL